MHPVSERWGTASNKLAIIPRDLILSFKVPVEVRCSFSNRAVTWQSCTYPYKEVTCRLSQETTDTEIQELFQLMDVNKDQKLAPKELDCVLRALGINATEADLIEFIGERELSGST